MSSSDGDGLDCSRSAATHDLAGLAVPALRRLGVDPGPLQRVEVTWRTKLLDGSDGFAYNRRDLDLTGTRGLAVDEDCVAATRLNSLPSAVSTSRADATAEPGAGEGEVVAFALAISGR
jgi:hypothetical protein